MMEDDVQTVLAPLCNRSATGSIPMLLRTPPQPHMCLEDCLKGSSLPCFINIMSWSLIGVPKPNSPVPLYGGVLVPFNSRTANLSFRKKKEPLIFAVMANPEILKKKGKMASNKQERNALIEMMLDFIEAMNPKVRFQRRYTVLKDRDLTGELKDIWAVVQEKRESEKNSRLRALEGTNYCWDDENAMPNGRNRHRPGRGSLRLSKLWNFDGKILHS